MLLGGFICQQLDWELLFYICGGLCLIWCVLWQIFVFPSPEEDPRISSEERDLIITSRGSTSSIKAKPSVPWAAIVTSKPVIVLVLAQLTCQWTIYLIFSLFPSFLSNIFNLDVQLVGIIAAIPAIACISAGVKGPQNFKMFLLNIMIWELQ